MGMKYISSIFAGVLIATSFVVASTAHANFFGDLRLSASSMFAQVFQPQLTLSIEKQEGLSITINGWTGPFTAGVYRISWDWGDGSKGEGWFPQSHTYSQSGHYTIRATSQGLFGDTTSSLDIDMGVKPPSAVAAPTQIISPGLVPKLTLSAPKKSGLAVEVNGYVENAEKLIWNWGDGSLEEEHWFPATHTYSQKKVYTITVRALAGNQVESKSVQAALISPPPPAPPPQAQCATASSQTDSVPTRDKIVCAIGGITIESSIVQDVSDDVGTSFIDITRAAVKQVSSDDLQLDMRLATKDIPFYPNLQNYLWLLDTDLGRSGYEFVVRLNAVSGSGVTNTWHVWLESLIENGRGIYHAPAAKFANEFSVLIPLKLLYDPISVTWKARAEYQNTFDETSSGVYLLNYQKAYPSVSLTADAEPILNSGAYYNDLSSGGIVSFSTTAAGVTEYFSSYERRLCSVSHNQFQGIGNGLSMVFARVNGCYLAAKPVVVANGNVKLQGANTAFIFNTGKSYDEGTMSVTDILSNLQKNLAGFSPHNGQLIIVEENDSNVLGSPNTSLPIPIPLYVPDTPDGSWFYFTHEYGHHFHGGNLKLLQLLKDFYAESIPSAIAFYAMEEVVLNPTSYVIPSSTITSIANNFSSVKNNFLTDLVKYETQGAPFSKLSIWPPQDFDPNNVYNGMMLRIQEMYGRRATKKFFDIFKPPEELIDAKTLQLLQPLTNDQKHTMFVAAWSVATGSDQRTLFYGWNYPIDETYYAKVLPVLQTYTGSTDTPVPVRSSSGSSFKSIFDKFLQIFQ